MKPEVKGAVEATVLEPSTAPTDVQLWGVYGPDCFPTVFACKLKDYPDAHRAIWGYSVYEGEPGYRTLGVDVDKGSVWPRDRNLRLFRYRQQAFDYIASLFPEPDAPSPPSALDVEGVVERLETFSPYHMSSATPSICKEAAGLIRTQAAALQSAEANARVWHNALDTACVILGVQASGSPGEMLSAIRAHDEAQSARLALTRAPDPATSLLEEAAGVVEPFARIGSLVDAYGKFNPNASFKRTAKEFSAASALHAKITAHLQPKGAGSA